MQLILPGLWLMICIQVYVQESSNPTRVKVSGPAIERPVKTFQPTYLQVDCSEAGPGKNSNSIQVFYFTDKK